MLSREEKEKWMERFSVRGRIVDMRNVPEEVKSDLELMIEAVRQDGYALAHASEELKDNTTLVLEAVKHTAGSRYYGYAGENAKKDPEVLKTVIKDDSSFLRYADEEFIKNNPDFIVEVVRENDLSDYDEYKKIFKLAKETIIDNYVENDKDSITEKTIDSDSEFFDLESYDENTGVYYRAAGNTKLFDTYNNCESTELLPTIKKGEFIPVDGKNIHLEYSTGRLIIPLEVCDDKFKRCISDEDYIKALNEMGYKVPPDACEFKESYIEPNEDNYGMAYGEGLSEELNKSLLHNFLCNYGEIDLNNFVNAHYNDLVNCLGGEEKLSRFVSEIEEEIGDNEYLYTTSDIAEQIEPREGEIEEVINETEEIARQNNREETIEQDGQTQADE